MLPIILAEPAAGAVIESILHQLGEDVCDVLADFGGRIVVLKEGQRFSEVSPVLRRIVAGVDAWPIPPAGLFVVEERTVYLRSLSPMAIAHELMHMVDAALGGGVYLSGVDPRIRRAFTSATAFCTPYAASACDEYWAESARAWVSINDAHSLWPRATRERLQSVDERMYAIVKQIFEEDIPTRAAGIRHRAPTAA